MKKISPSEGPPKKIPAPGKTLQHDEISTPEGKFPPFKIATWNPPFLRSNHLQKSFIISLIFEKKSLKFLFA